MRTDSILLIGFGILIVIFGISSYYQWNYSLDIKDVSEYNRSMSVPAIALLQQIKLDFQVMHVATVQLTQHDPSSEIYQEFEEKYQESKLSLFNNIQRYDGLAYVKN